MSEKRKRAALQAVLFGVKSIVKIAVYLVIVWLIIQICKYAFSFGYAVFYQKPVAETYGKEITIEIPEGASTSEISKILEENGLIQDSKVFILQEFFSNYHGKLQAGTYVLSTDQTADEMLEILGGSAVEDVE